MTNSLVFYFLQIKFVLLEKKIKKMNTKKEQAHEIIQYNVLWAMGAGAIPIPILDAAAVTMVQLDMLKQLCKVYGLDYEERSGKNTISAIAGSTLASIGASFIKAIPGVGSLLGGISMVALSGGSTYAMGQVFVNHFESGGSVFNFDINRSKKVYEEEFEKGKEYASSLQKTEKTSSKAETFAKLDKLVQLKKSGVITEAEFNQKKAELLKEL
jgi:uncharacterized protein (DUF697 family)